MFDGQEIYVLKADGKSTEYELKLGVPQRRVLSSFLIKSLMAELHVLPPALQWSIYADRWLMLWPSRTTIQIVQGEPPEGLNIINEFLKAHGMK